MYLALDTSYWLTLLISIPTAGFLLRTFILFHDCTHGSLFHSKRANTWGGRFFGLLVFQCFAKWRQSHLFHHGSAGDLDRRGTGDVMTWTVEEYYSKPWRSRLGYRLFRHPAVMFGIGPLWSLLIGPRIWAGSKRGKMRNSILLTNLGVIAMVGAAMAVFGVTEVLADRGAADRPRRAPRASGSSSSSTSSRTSTGRTPTAGTTRWPRSRAAPT